MKNSPQFPHHLAAVITEGAVYLAEFVRLVFRVMPIGLLLIGITFLRRQQPTRILFGMQLTVALWLALGVINPLLGAWSRGLFSSNKDDSLERLRVYLSISDVAWNLETLSFLLFAILFLIYCRQRVAKDDLV